MFRRYVVEAKHKRILSMVLLNDHALFNIHDEQIGYVFPTILYTVPPPSTFPSLGAVALLTSVVYVSNYISPLLYDKTEETLLICSDTGDPGSVGFYTPCVSIFHTCYLQGRLAGCVFIFMMQLSFLFRE